MSNWEDPDVIIPLVATGAVIGVAATISCTVCCLRRGCCGPRGLKEGDIQALETFNDIYRFQQIDVGEGFFEKVESSAFCKLRSYTRSARPVHKWSSLMPGFSSGFLVDVAKHVDEALLAFQHRMWDAKGEWISYLPTFLVAQEWREWAMTELQRIEAPHLEHREMLDRRLRWIANAREVARTEIMELRQAEGWDETEELSLLSVLRQQVGRELRLVYDRWETYQLQVSFAANTDMINGFLIQFVRSGVQFLRKVIRQDRIHENEFIKVVETGAIISKPCTFCCGLKNWQAHALDHKIDAWLAEINIFDPQFPGNFRTTFFTDKRLKELEEGTAKVRPLKPLNPFAPWDESRLDYEERNLAKEVMDAYSPADFGLQEHEFKVLVQRSVTLLSALKYCTVSIMVLESLKNFAVLGGAIFLAAKMSTEHVMEILKFVGLAVDSAESDLVAVADLAQSGWSNLRRTDRESHWSNTTPVDNVRAALHIKSDMVRTARDAQETVKVLKAETMSAEKVDEDQIEDKLQHELEFHLHLWELISKHFEKQKKKKSRSTEEAEAEDQALTMII
ncbi:unnamed protein product [Durusdinium trenchii]|uniref:Uncharacterized protein n=2 Tax=Durusdinium trenchii TaxID=1381693 RepID=A0ABP0N9X5_9DINO